LFTGAWSVVIGIGVTRGKALSQIVRLRRGREERQADRERRSFTRPRAQNHTPTHRFSQTAGYEQAQAETACGLRQSGVHAVEALEHAILVVDADRLAPSLHGHKGTILAL